MTSLDRLPLTTAPDLDPSGVNFLTTPMGWTVTVYYSPITQTWEGFDYRTSDFHRMPGIDATDWPEVWAEIVSKEQ